MSSIRNKKLKRLVLMTVAGMALHLHGGVAHASETIIDGDSYTVDDATVETDGNYDLIYGGGSGESNTDDVLKNRLTIESGTFNGLFGGMSSTGDVSGNRITFNGGTVAGGIVGGVTFFAYDRSTSAGDVTGNVVNVTGGSVGYVSGGEVAYMYPATSSAVPDVTQSYFLTGGNVIDNTVNISGGTVTGAVIGGSSLTGRAEGNVVNIRGGTISGAVIGGESQYRTSSSTAANNIINISGSPNLSGAYFYGGLIEGSANPTGNLLNINANDITVRGIDFNSFEKVNFRVPANVRSGGDILTVTGGSTSVALDKIGFAIDGNSRLDTNDTVNLIIDGTSTAYSADYAEDGSYNTTMNKGATLLYNVNLANSADGVTATIGELIGPSPNPVADPSKHDEEFSQLQNHRPDPFTEMMTEDYFSDEANEVVPIHMINGFSVFLNTGGGRIKTKTGGGTYTKTKNGNLDMGFARSLETSSGNLYIAPVFEHVRGSYDSVLPNNIHGTGDTRYTAGGFMTRKVNKSGVYYEGSLRGGRSKNSFESNDFVINNVKTRVTYEMSAPVFTGHLRFGQAKRLNRNNLLDMYGTYSYARQNGMSSTLSSGDHVHFSSVDSNSFRTGYRLTTRTSLISRIYTGLAYQYDRNSDSTATATKYSKTAVGAKGSSGMLELGWQIKPYRDNPWLLDLNAVGWAGHHQGFSALARVQKSF